MPVVDAHQHFWDPNAADYPWMTGDYEPLRRRFQPADLEPQLTEAGIDATIVVQARHELDETRRLLEIAEATDWVAGVVGWVDLTASDVDRTIATIRAEPGGERLVGIRHQVHDEPDPGWLLRPDVLRGLAAVADAGLAFDLLVRTRGLQAAVDVARRLPQLVLVVDHLAKPPVSSGEVEPWASLLRELGALEHVTAKVSGLVTEASWTGWRRSNLEPYVKIALDVFGPDRLMFGSDWPVCLLAAGYQEVFDTTVAIVSEFGSDTLDSILGRCAVRTYGLRP
jgi:L-fuconolactonase